MRYTIFITRDQCIRDGSNTRIKVMRDIRAIGFYSVVRVVIRRRIFSIIYYVLITRGRTCT